MQSLELVVRENGLDKSKADFLLEKFQDAFRLASDWELKAKMLTVTRDDQVAEMKMAREGRLFLKQKRIDIEKTRKEMKEQSLREGKAIDGIANILKALIEPIESFLEKQEKFLEIKEAEKREELRLEQLKQAEEERIAKAKAEAEERERQRIEKEKIKLENERLKKDAEEKAKALEIERKQQAEVLRKQQEEALRKQREIEAKAKAERDIAIAEERRKAEEKAKALEEKSRIENEKLQAELKAKQKKMKCLEIQKHLQECEECFNFAVQLIKSKE